MSKYFKRLRETFSRGRSTGKLLPAYRTVYGEPKAVTFSHIMTAYTRDPSCKAFVDFLADQALGMGFYTTVNEDYDQAEKANQVVDEFNENVNLDGLLQIGARETVASGNSFWLKNKPQRLENLNILPLTGFDNPKAVMRDQYGEVTGYNYAYGDVKTNFPPEKIIHFKWNQVDFSAFGTGVPQVLLTELSFSGHKGHSTSLATIWLPTPMTDHLLPQPSHVIVCASITFHLDARQPIQKQKKRGDERTALG